MNRKEILDRARSPEERILLARLIDKIELTQKLHDMQTTDFCDPYQQNLITPVLHRVPGISFIWAGGFSLAERRRLLICPDYLEPGEQDPQLQVLAVSGNLKFQKLTHRDYLGALLALGIKREKMGDVVVTEHGCHVIVAGDIADYIRANLTKVGRLAVQVEKIPLAELAVPAEEAREVFATVPSLRLDAVAAAGYGVSRSKIAADIAAEKARVNWAVVSDGAFSIKEGDKLSVRGRGRLEVEKVKGETKKGRISLILKRYQ